MDKNVYIGFRYFREFVILSDVILVGLNSELMKLLITQVIII